MRYLLFTCLVGATLSVLWPVEVLRAQTDAAAAGSAAKMHAAAERELRQSLGTSDRTRVIVRLAPDALRDVEASVPARFAQGPRAARRAAIATVQERLEQRLRLRGWFSRLRNLPFALVEVDENALDRLLADAEVARVELDQTHAPSLETSIVMIGADVVHANGITGQGTTVAILDTGVDRNHDAFVDAQTGESRVVAEACFSRDSSRYGSHAICPVDEPDEIESRTDLVSASYGAGAGSPCAYPGCDHGTHVAGIAAGAGGGVVGVATGADIVAIQVFSHFDSSGTSPLCSDCVLTWSSDYLKALDYLVTLKVEEGRNIVAANLSFGESKYTRADECDYTSGGSLTSMRETVDELLGLGIATVISAGNDGYDFSVGSPACVSSAVSVAANTDDLTISSYSNMASWVDLFAPGDGVVSAREGGGVVSKSGTSMSAPHVTGSFALLAEAAGDATTEELLSALRLSGSDLSSGPLSAPAVDVDIAVSRLQGGQPYPLEVILDNGQQGHGSVVSGAFGEVLETDAGGDQRLAYAGLAERSSGGASDIYAFMIDLPRSGVYRVHGWWPALPDNSAATQYDFVNLSGAVSVTTNLQGTATVVVDQSADGGQWNVLGDFELRGDGTESVQISDALDSAPVVADALRLVYLSGSPITIDTLSLPAATTGSAYQADVTVSGGTAPHTLTLSSDTLPAGLDFDPAAQRLSGVPTAAGAASLRFEVVDTDGQFAAVDLLLTVLEASPPEAADCAVTTDKASYSDGEQVTVTGLRFSNLSATDSLEVRLRWTLDVAGLQAWQLIDVGAGGGLVFPASFDTTLGPFGTAVISSGMPRGTWAFECFVEDPSTGAVLGQSRAVFDVN